MADLPELNEWPEGIYQLETSDPVLGGPEGIDNLQAKQLASRTKWLRDQIDKVIAGTNAVGKALQLKTARTLKFKGAATGSGTYDGSADTEITLALADSGVEAGSFTKVSVTLKGLVTGGSNPTTLFGYGITDAFTKDATAAAISDAISGHVVSVAASRPLTQADMGLVLIDSSASAITLQLPKSDAALGIRDLVVRRTDNTGNRLVIQADGTDKIKFHTHLRAAGYSFFVLMGAGDFWHLRSDGAGSWFPIARFDATPLGRPVFETIMAFQPGGWAGSNNVYLRAEWPWVWDHAQASGMLTTEAARGGMEGGWTSGDGATTFRTPDPRGKFFRPLDESAGIDPGRVAGSYRLDDFKSHAHYQSSTGYGTQAVGGGSITYATPTGGSTGAAGGAETVPKHIAWPVRLKMI